MKLKRLRIEKMELQYAEALTDFQDLSVTLARIEYDEFYRRRNIQNYLHERPFMDYVI